MHDSSKMLFAARWTRLASGQFLGSFVALSILASGCGKVDANRAAITGEVALDGQILQQGSIVFTPTDGTKGTTAGGTIANGRYQLTSNAGPSVGWNRVEIRALRKTGKQIPAPFPARNKMTEEQVEAIPSQFNTESKLKVEVQRGENTADFKVTSK